MSIRMLTAMLGILAIGLLSQPVFGQNQGGIRPLPPVQGFDAPASSELQPIVPPQGLGEPFVEPEPVPAPAADVPESTKQWWSPDTWIRQVEWEGGVEFGLNGTAGNSESVSLRAAANAKRKTELHEFTWDLTYAKTNSDGVETQNFGILNAGYERFLGESRWTYFIKQQLNYDEFKAFDLRIVLNSGVGYQFVETDTLNWKSRFGAGASHEIGGPDDNWVPEALFGTDFDWQFSERQKLTSKVDYFPAWADFHDYRIYSDIGWEILLNEAHALNLKLSIIDQYDSTPNGSKPNDVNYAVLLLWKM